MPPTNCSVLGINSASAAVFVTARAIALTIPRLPHSLADQKRCRLARSSRQGARFPTLAIQARDIFEGHGVPVLRGITATTPAEAKDAAAAIGTPVVVVKAQVKTGGRGKAGGVKIAKSPDEAEARAAEILGLDIKGHVVKTVMIAEGADIAEEYYFSVLLDRAERRYLAMCSKEGGMDIETLAEERSGTDPGGPWSGHRRCQGR